MTTHTKTIDVEEIVKEAQERINNARKFNWTGGFEQVFFEDWLRTTLTTLLTEADRRVEEARSEERKYIGRLFDSLVLNHIPPEDEKINIPYHNSIRLTQALLLGEDAGESFVKKTTTNTNPTK